MKERSRSHGFRQLRSGGAEYLSPLEAPYRFRDLKNDSVDAMVTELGIQMVEYEKSILRNQRMKLAFENGLRSSPNDLQVRFDKSFSMESAAPRKSISVCFKGRKLPTPI
jgi:hypothetical protein